MSQFQIQLEGAAGVAFAESLKSLLGDRVSYQVSEPATVRGDEKKQDVAKVLITLKVVLDLTGQTIDVTNKALDLVDRIQEYQSSSGKPVLVMSQGESNPLRNATHDEILKALLKTQST
jgi:hypothetical protein